MSETEAGSVTLPFSLVAPLAKRNPFVEKASVTFNPNSQTVQVESGGFQFCDGLMNSVVKVQPPLLPNFEKEIQSNTIPVFSIFSVVLLILLRNLFFSSFQKYFLSFQNNYEIDFNIQKIGFFPLLISILVILFSFTNLIQPPNQIWFSDIQTLGNKFKISIEVLFFPIQVSIVIFFFLNLSTRLFPIIFSDIKIMFLIAILVLIWNFLVFGTSMEMYLTTKKFLFFISLLFLTLRSILLLNVFRRAYRFHLAITLFYICTLNLGTFLVFYQSLWVDILRLL